MSDTTQSEIVSDLDWKPELLAPAGNLDAAFTAFAAGADAVYAGLSQFNARERGDNFSLTDLRRLLTYARRRQGRVYVTLNTLLKETELPAIAEILAELALLRPDAVIVQDLGLLYLLREQLPELPVHASTQMGIHNSAGVRLVEAMGVERVILERQVPLSELAQIRQQTDLELEVFVHGALCCCRSGACLFSSWLGGWSGNRGKCKQPCRRRFYADEGNGFFFSTNDLYSLDLLPRLRELGIASLKIEGRLRGSDYVHSVVSAYRQVLDADAGSEAAMIKAARGTLSGALGRRWSPGFRRSEDFATVIEHERPGVSGLLVGTVSKAGEQGFTIRLTRPLSVGDRVRIQPTSGDDSPGVTVTQLTVGRRTVDRARPGDNCFVPCDKEVPKAGKVYMIGHEAPPIPSDCDEVEPFLACVDLAIQVTSKQLAIDVIGWPELSWRQEWTLAPAKKRPLTEDNLITEFRRTRNECLQANQITVAIDGEWFLPASERKQYRRQFWEWLSAKLDTNRRQAWLSKQRARLKEYCGAQQKPATCNPPESTVLVAAGRSNPHADSWTARELGDPDDADEIVLPDFCPETELSKLRSQLRRRLQMGCQRVRVTSLYGLQVLAEEGTGDNITCTASFPLPVTNHLAFDCLRRLGADRVGAWVELDRDALEALLNAVSSPMEVLTYGRLPILATRAQLPVSGRITDDRGNAYEIFERTNETWLLPEKPLALSPRPGQHRFIDLRHVGPDAPVTSSFNYDFDWT